MISEWQWLLSNRARALEWRRIRKNSMEKMRVEQPA